MSDGAADSMPVAGSQVRIDFRKWPDKKHWQYPMTYLGEDEYGRWLWAPAGLVAYRGDQGPIALPSASVKLVSAEWWVATFRSGPDGRTSTYVDVIAPASWSGDAVTMLDLDLDVEAGSDGILRLLDRDEFEENKQLLNYPAEIVAGAENAAKLVHEALLRGDEPFRSAGWKRLAEAMAAHEAGVR